MSGERTVTCAWCGCEMRVHYPDVGVEGYFILPRQCRSCAGNNVIELSGGLAEVRQLRRGRKRGSVTQKILIRRARAG
jgi:hypothetical protein